MLRVEVPYHSPAMDSILAEFQECISSIRPQPGEVALVSTVTGKLLPGERIRASLLGRQRTRAGPLLRGLWRTAVGGARPVHRSGAASRPGRLHAGNRGRRRSGPPGAAVFAARRSRTG